MNPAAQQNPVPNKFILEYFVRLKVINNVENYNDKCERSMHN